MTAVQFLLTANRVLRNFSNIYSKDDMIFATYHFRISVQKLQYAYIFYGVTFLFADLPSYLFLEL